MAPTQDPPNGGICVFCGKPYVKENWMYGNNPEPLFPYDEHRACDECNAKHVVPARLRALRDR
jgi:hypothetical protein